MSKLSVVMKYVKKKSKEDRFTLVHSFGLSSSE